MCIYIRTERKSKAEILIALRVSSNFVRGTYITRARRIVPARAWASALDVCTRIRVYYAPEYKTPINSVQSVFVIFPRAPPTRAYVLTYDDAIVPVRCYYGRAKSFLTVGRQLEIFTTTPAPLRVIHCPLPFPFRIIVVRGPTRSLNFRRHYSLPRGDISVYSVRSINGGPRNDAISGNGNAPGRVSVPSARAVIRSPYVRTTPHRHVERELGFSLARRP